MIARLLALSLLIPAADAGTALDGPDTVSLETLTLASTVAAVTRSLTLPVI